MNYPTTHTSLRTIAQYKRDRTIAKIKKVAHDLGLVALGVGLGYWLMFACRI